jgi:hypothetical protein
MLNRLRTLALLLSCPLVTFGAGSPTTTSLTTSAPASAIFGAPLTLTATVSGLAVTGRVTLYDNANVPGSAAVSGGKATPVALASADLNGDGKTDVAVVGGAQGVRILLGNGDGSLRPPSVYQPDGYGIVTADFKRGRQDRSRDRRVRCGTGVRERRCFVPAPQHLRDAGRNATAKQRLKQRLSRTRGRIITRISPRTDLHLVNFASMALRTTKSHQRPTSGFRPCLLVNPAPCSESL